MKQRRTIFIVGIVAIALVMAVVGLAVYFLHALEKEKNKWMTAQPRAVRHADKKPVQQQEQETPINEQSDNDFKAPVMAAN